MHKSSNVLPMIFRLPTEAEIHKWRLAMTRKAIDPLKLTGIALEELRKWEREGRRMKRKKTRLQVTHGRS